MRSMSENNSSARTLALLALVIAIVLGGLTFYQSAMTHRSNLELAKKLDHLEAQLALQQEQIAAAQTDAKQIRQQLTQVGTAAEIKALGTKIQALTTRSVRFDAAATRLDALQTKLDKLGEQNDELIRYIDQRIRSIRSFAEKIIPSGKKVSSAEHYRIQSGETLESIAEKLDISLSALIQANPDVDAKRLQIGQSIKLPKE
jgi:LysM repeat protein